MQMYDVPRCKSCGDALDISDPNAQYIVCKSCGCTNLKSDAMEALNQAKAEIMSWLRQAIPAGINVEQTETMDPIARHNIFMTNVRPSVESEFREYRFGFINILSNQLIAMPFRTLKSINVKHEPKLLFTFDSKIKSVQSLAVDDEAKLTAYYGSREEYEKIVSWEQMRPEPLETDLEKARAAGQVADLPKGYDDTKSIYELSRDEIEKAADKKPTKETSTQPKRKKTTKSK